MARSTQHRKWETFSDEQLLDLRVCDLKVTLAESASLTRRIARLDEELEARGFVFRPHYWLSDEWFSPDGVPGIAIPFYLAHKRLARLERNQVFEVEGGSERHCMRILRHELGHTIDTAYRLHRRRTYRELFGSASKPYPDFYKPKPLSRNFVIHFDLWYAQSHPSEDFAETFAVWFSLRRQWRKRYEGWPALKKLEYMDALMKEIRETPPLIRSREHVDPLSRNRMTLRTHYQLKRDKYGVNDVAFYDQELRKLFSDAPEHIHNISAAQFLRSLRGEIRSIVARWSGEYQYSIDQLLTEMVQRCRELKLRIGDSPEQLRLEAISMVTVQTMNRLHSGYHRLAL